MGGGVLVAAVLTVVLVLGTVIFVRRTVRADREVGEVGATRLATWHHTGLTHGGRSDDDRWPA